MRRSFLLLAVAALLGAPVTASGAQPGKPPKCTGKAKTKKQRARCGNQGPRPDKKRDELWRGHWRLKAVDLDGTTTLRWDDGSTSYSVDGKMAYRGPKVTGTLELGGSGPWVFDAKGVKVTSVAQSRYVHEGKAYDCSYTSPASLMPERLGGVATRRGKDLAIQWSFGSAATKCPVEMFPTWSTPLPTRALTTVHTPHDLLGDRVELRVAIDETVKETYGSMRVRWNGTVTLERIMRP